MVSSKRRNKKPVSRKPRKTVSRKKASRKAVSRKKPSRKKAVARKRASRKRASRKRASRKKPVSRKKTVCKDDQEINQKTGRCRKKCKEDEERNQETGRCKKVASRKPASKKPASDNKYQTALSFVIDDPEDEIDDNDDYEIVREKASRKYAKYLDKVDYVVSHLHLTTGKTSSKKRPIVSVGVKPSDELLDLSDIARDIVFSKITDRDTLERLKYSHTMIWLLNKLVKSQKYKHVRAELKEVLVKFVSYFEEYNIKNRATMRYLYEIRDLRDILEDPIEISDFFKTPQGKKIQSALMNLTSELAKTIVRSALEYNAKVEKYEDAPMFSNDMNLMVNKYQMENKNIDLNARPKKHIGPLKWIDENAVSASKILQFLNHSVDHGEYDVYDENDVSWNQNHHQPIAKDFFTAKYM